MSKCRLRSPFDAPLLAVVLASGVGTVPLAVTVNVAVVVALVPVEVRVGFATSTPCGDPEGICCVHVHGTEALEALAIVDVKVNVPTLLSSPVMYSVEVVSGPLSTKTVPPERYS